MQSRAAGASGCTAAGVALEREHKHVAGTVRRGVSGERRAVCRAGDGSTGGPGARAALVAPDTAGSKTGASVRSVVGVQPGELACTITGTALQ